MPLQRTVVQTKGEQGLTMPHAISGYGL